MTPRPCSAFPQPDHSCIALAVNLADEENSFLANILRGSNWIVKNARTCQQAFDLSRNGPVPVVLCQPHMPDGTWNNLMERMRELAVPPAVVVVSRLADEHLWAEVLNLGGYDVLMVPFDRTEVFRVLFLAWMASQREAAREQADLKKPPAAEKIAPVPDGIALRASANSSFVWQR